MRAIQTGFGGEKVCFLISSAVAACAVYSLLASAPARLNPGAPVSATLAPPEALNAVPLPARGDEEAFVNSSVDAQTGARINRDRSNPFAPYQPVIRKIVIPSITQGKTEIAPPARVAEPPPHHDREFAPVVLASAVEYTGVLSVNGVTVGLLHHKDGSGYLRVSEGSEFAVGGVNYRVTSLEKQAICVARGDVSIRLKSN